MICILPQPLCAHLKDGGSDTSTTELLEGILGSREGLQEWKLLFHSISHGLSIWGPSHPASPSPDGAMGTLESQGPWKGMAVKAGTLPLALGLVRSSVDTCEPSLLSCPRGR